MFVACSPSVATGVTLGEAVMVTAELENPTTLAVYVNDEKVYETEFETRTLSYRWEPTVGSHSVKIGAHYSLGDDVLTAPVAVTVSCAPIPAPVVDTVFVRQGATSVSIAAANHSDAYAYTLWDSATGGSEVADFAAPTLTLARAFSEPQTFYLQASATGCSPSVRAEVILAPVLSDFSAVCDTIMRNIQVAQQAAGAPSELPAVNADGSVTGITYSDKSQTSWKPLEHLDKLKSFVLAYTVEESSKYNNNATYSSIVKMLEYWYAQDPYSTNWYYNEIAVPQRLGILLIMMRTAPTPLPSELEANLVKRMKDRGSDPATSTNGSTGANKIDIAAHWVYRGCLTQDRAVLEKGITQAFLPLAFTTSEGIQHDYSYHQHGAQLYIGGYGSVVLQNIANLTQHLVGTSYAPTPEQLNALSLFVRKAYIPAIRASTMLPNVLGRSISRSGALNQTGFVAVLRQMLVLDPANAADYNAAIDKIQGRTNDSSYPAYHAHFWRSDYTLHQRKGYTFDVRSVSTATGRNESGNGENLKGYFLSDGATTITVGGSEYATVIPAWDWGRIPGTTTPALTSGFPVATWTTKGAGTFAGGVSDGTYGVSTYFMTNNSANVKTDAKKSWFFFDGEVACLGAGITSTHTAQINTTLNQCRLNTTTGVEVITRDKTSELKLSEGEHPYANGLLWVVHNKVGYYLPQESSVMISNKIQQGSWYDINTTQSNASAAQRVFKLWVDHGEKPGNATYAYVVAPGVESVEAAKAYPIRNVKILQNSEQVQAVMHSRLGIVGVVFYSAGAFTANGITISADKPCAVMLRDAGSELKVYVADPSRSLSSLKVTVALPGLSSAKELTFALPTGAAEKGKTCEQAIVKDNATATIVSPTDEYDEYGNPDNPNNPDDGKTSVDTSALPRVQVYPNPVKKGSLIHVDFGAAKGEAACVVNLLGQTLLRTTDRSIGTAALAPGIYFIAVCDRHGRRKSVTKFVVE